MLFDPVAKDLQHSILAGPVVAAFPLFASLRLVHPEIAHHPTMAVSSCDGSLLHWLSEHAWLPPLGLRVLLVTGNVAR
jgi:hypothetical protein